MIKQWEYEFDPYGDNPKNRIKGERHTITPANGKNFSFFIPKKAPFHRREVVLKDANTGALLNPGTDYYFGWRYNEIILGGAVQPVYGAIVLNNPFKAHQIVMDYNTVGGDTVLDDTEIAQLLANTQRDPRRALWTDVVNVPDMLPPVAHRQHQADVIGYEAEVEVLYKIADAIAEGNVKSMQALMEHVKDKNNPHHITLADLGIDELGSLIGASKEEAESGTENTHYMTSLRVAQYCDAKVIPVLQAHKDDKQNPHGTTKAQVGLGSVQNYPMASNDEAEQAVATNRYMSPSTTVVLMNAKFVPLLNKHIDDKQNPHGVTKSQVGLGNVENYGVATSAEAGAGVEAKKYMTPALTAVAIAALTAPAMEFHTKDTDNPHNTTKTQVGLSKVENYPPATIQEALAGTPERYITADILSKVIDVGGGSSGGGQALTQHLQDTDNPHDVTKTQVGLGSVQNYAEATAQDMETLIGDPKYITTTTLKSWLEPNGGWAKWINKQSIGLGNVQNYPIATDADIRATSNHTYATPETVSKMMEDGIETWPMLTAATIDINTYKSVPYAAMEVNTSYMVDPSATGFVVGYDIGQVLEPFAFLYTDFELAGKLSYNAKLTRIKGTKQTGFMFATLDDGDKTHLLGLMLDQSSIKLCYFDQGLKTFVPIGDSFPITDTPASVNELSAAIELDPTAKSYKVTLKTNSSGSDVVISGTATSLLTALGSTENAADSELGGLWGFFTIIDVEGMSTAGTTMSADYLPNAEDNFMYNINTRQRWGFDGRKWVNGEILEPGDTPSAVVYKLNTTYWNPATDELFLGVTPRHVVPYGMASIVD